MSSTNLLGRVRRATAKRSAANAEWHEAIRTAVHSGLTVRDVASAAGVSHARVHQIARE